MGRKQLFAAEQARIIHLPADRVDIGVGAAGRSGKGRGMTGAAQMLSVRVPPAGGSRS